MILIDKNKEYQNIILTLTESTDGSAGDYLLNLISDSTRKEYSFQLPENPSAFTERYDLFKMDTDVFTELTGGFYGYQILVDGNVVERGKAQVLTVPDSSSNIIQPNSSNEILIYGE